MTERGQLCPREAKSDSHFMKAIETTTPVQHRRVIIDLEVRGTPEQADAVRDAVGLATNDEHLSKIVTPIAHSEEIEHVKWTVRGERWVPNA